MTVNGNAALQKCHNAGKVDLCKLNLRYKTSTNSNMPFRTCHEAAHGAVVTVVITQQKG